MVKGTVLKDMGTYKDQLISTFANDADICELLLNKQTYTEDDAGKLMYTQIFPYLYTDKDQADVLSYLCFEVDVAKIATNTIKDMKLIIWSYCHKDIMQYSKEGYSGTRVDILCDMVERQIRDYYKLGIGKAELVSVTNFSPNDKYYGKQIVYNIPDFKIKG